MFLRFFAGLLLASLPVAAMSAPETRPLVIAHRGASADRPEHTLMAYKLAIEQGADVIEPDLVATRDGHLVARHENEISTTSDVADRPEFANRRTRKTIDGQQVEGWFTEDFTLAELKQLRARERLPQLRPANKAYDGIETIPTFNEIIDLVKSEEKRTGRRIGLYPETKHPGYFRSIGLPLEEPLLAALSKAGYRARTDPVFIQSFEAGNLETLRPKTQLRLIQLMSVEGGPADRPGTRYADMATAAGLKQLARHVDGVGLERDMVIPRTADGKLGAPSTVVTDAHAAGLAVHVWTFRPENYFLPAEFRSGEDLVARGNEAGEIEIFLKAGIDGFFSDSVTEAIRARDAATKAEPAS